MRRRAQPIKFNGGLKGEFWVRKSDLENIYRRPQSKKWWTERKNSGSENRTKKLSKDVLG